MPGSDGAGLDDAALALAVEQVGYPVLLKPSAGGGGKGMREVHAPDELAAAIASARREARGSFGDDTLLVERLVATPRHIEIQVMADAHGNVIHLGERECSLQRRHQKIVEEAPSALLTPAQRAAMGEAALRGGPGGRLHRRRHRRVHRAAAGRSPDEFFFMEMNTRLQVEHPVTEMVTGLDLVELQLRVAAGEPLPIGQDDVRLAGTPSRSGCTRKTLPPGSCPPAGASWACTSRPATGSGSTPGSSRAASWAATTTRCWPR